VSVPPKIALLRGSLGRDATLEVALAGAILDAVAKAGSMPMLRFYRPPATVAFGRQDAFLPGFAEAAAAARDHGFTPVLRAPGGHAAAYDERSLVLDEVLAERDSITGIHARFADRAQSQAQALRRLGVDAQIGKVAGEYCPGDFTVSAGGRTKLVGAAQRVVRGGWLFSTVVVVEGEDRIRAVLDDVYAALALDWDPQTVGSVAAEVPGTSVDDVEQALLEAYGARFELVPSVLTPELLAAAERSRDRHRVDTG
jgi:lipoate-protein ligase A